MQEYKTLGVACAAAAAAGVALVAYTLAGKKKATPTPTMPSSSQTAPKASQFSSPLEQLESDLTNKTSREILLEQMDRTRLFYGEEAWANIEKAFVVVVGVGGVGSAAAHVLVRSGVGRLRLVDPDAVTLSSLNRNAVAMRADVGSPKVATLAKYFKLINPDTKVETMETFFEESIASSVLSGKPDLVLDCIDNRETKAQLISYCAANNIKVVSCFGAGCVMDFKSIRVVDLASTHGCPLAKKVRREIREYCAKHGLPSPVDGETNDPILCVYSNEQRKKKLKPLTDEELANLRAQGVKRTVRVRTLGVTMVMPTVFGGLIADTALSLLAGVPVEYEKEVNVGAKQFSISKMLKTLKKREARLFKTPRVQIEKTLGTFVAIHLLETVFNKSSAISGKNKYLNFVRWRPNKPFAIDNVAVVTESEAEAHAAVTDVDAFYPPELVKEIDAKLAAVPAAYEKAIADGKVKVQERAEKKKKNEKPQQTPETTTTTTTADDKVAEPAVTDATSN